MVALKLPTLLIRKLMVLTYMVGNSASLLLYGMVNTAVGGKVIKC